MVLSNRHRMPSTESKGSESESSMEHASLSARDELIAVKDQQRAESETRRAHAAHAPQLPIATPCSSTAPNGGGWEGVVEQDATKEHWILPAFASGVYGDGAATSKNVPPHSITFVSHSTVDHLPALVQLVAAWEGPISVAVFLSSGDEWQVMQHAARVIAGLRHCSPLINDSVSFHFVLPKGTRNGAPKWCWDQQQPLLHMAELLSARLNKNININIASDRVRTSTRLPWQKHDVTGASASASEPESTLVWNCEASVYATLKQFAEAASAAEAAVDSTNNRDGGGGGGGGADATFKNYAHVQHAYPNNLLRNVARKRTTTPFSLVADIDLIPRPRTLQQDFQKLVASGDLNPDANGGRVAF
eukprot:gene26061-6760_t